MSVGLLKIHAKPGRLMAFALSWILFAAALVLYFNASADRHRENAEDKVIPSLQQLADGFVAATFKPADDNDEPTPEDAPLWKKIQASMIWKDTLASSRRFIYSMLLLIPAVALGLHMGMFPYMGAFFLRFILFFDKIIALSVLPILFIAFGIDELSKIMLIVIGVAPTIILDTFNLTKGVPKEQVVKAFTLGANDFDITYRVVMKQTLPKVLNSIRLNLKAIMLFLFAGEMIASTDGLAYRIALLRRHMGMDIIIPYVLWVALLLFMVDQLMRVANRRMHPWFREA
jgi:NitT/TauT family transport system permease protein